MKINPPKIQQNVKIFELQIEKEESNISQLAFVIDKKVNKYLRDIQGVSKSSLRNVTRDSSE